MDGVRKRRPERSTQQRRPTCPDFCSCFAASFALYICRDLKPVGLPAFNFKLFWALYLTEGTFFPEQLRRFENAKPTAADYNAFFLIKKRTCQPVDPGNACSLRARLA